MKIRFTYDPKLPIDLVHLGYKQGMEVELSDDSANRWINRGVAIEIKEQVRTRKGEVRAEAEAREPSVPSLRQVSEAIPEKSKEEFDLSTSEEKSEASTSSEDSKVKEEEESKSKVSSTRNPFKR